LDTQRLLTAIADRNDRNPDFSYLLSGCPFVAVIKLASQESHLLALMFTEGNFVNPDPQCFE